MRVYVASSWRNELQPALVGILRHEGHEVYDFRNPVGASGFGWADVTGVEDRTVADKGTDLVPASEYLRMIAHPKAAAGFHTDYTAMRWADTFVMLLPCGKSAHLELGWAIGAGKHTAILLDDPMEPELMYLAADLVTASTHRVLDWLEGLGGLAKPAP